MCPKEHRSLSPAARAPLTYCSREGACRRDGGRRWPTRLHAHERRCGLPRQKSTRNCETAIQCVLFLHVLSCTRLLASPPAACRGSSPLDLFSFFRVFFPHPVARTNSSGIRKGPQGGALSYARDPGVINGVVNGVARASFVLFHTRPLPFSIHQPSTRPFRNRSRHRLAHSDDTLNATWRGGLTSKRGGGRVIRLEKAALIYVYARFGILCAASFYRVERGGNHFRLEVPQASTIRRLRPKRRAYACLRRF